MINCCAVQNSVDSGSRTSTSALLTVVLVAGCELEGGLSPVVFSATFTGFGAIYDSFVLQEDTRWYNRLRHCATERSVSGSIPDGVIGIFHGHNPVALWPWG